MGLSRRPGPGAAGSLQAVTAIGVVLAWRPGWPGAGRRRVRLAAGCGGGRWRRGRGGSSRLRMLGAGLAEGRRSLAAALGFPEVRGAVVLHLHASGDGLVRAGGRLLDGAGLAGVLAGLGTGPGSLVLVACQGAGIAGGLAEMAGRPVVAATTSVVTVAGRVLAAPPGVDAEGRALVGPAGDWTVTRPGGAGRGRVVVSLGGPDLLAVLDVPGGAGRAWAGPGPVVPGVPGGGQVWWAGRRGGGRQGPAPSRQAGAGAGAGRAPVGVRRELVAARRAFRLALGRERGGAGPLRPDRDQGAVLAVRGLQAEPGAGTLAGALLVSAPGAFGPAGEAGALEARVERFAQQGAPGPAGDAGEEAGDGAVGRVAARFGLAVTVVGAGGQVRVIGAGSRAVTVVQVPGGWLGAGPARGFTGARLAFLLQHERAAWPAADQGARDRAEAATDQALARQPLEALDDAALLNNLHAAIAYWREHGHLEPPRGVAFPGRPSQAPVRLGMWMRKIGQENSRVRWGRPALGVMGVRWNHEGRGEGSAPQRGLAARLRAEGRARRDDPGAARNDPEVDSAFRPAGADRVPGDVTWLREAVARWRLTGTLDPPLDPPPGGPPGGRRGGEHGTLDEWLAAVVGEQARGQTRLEPWMLRALGAMGIGWRAGDDRARIAVLLAAEREAWLSGSGDALAGAERATDSAMVPLPADSATDGSQLNNLRAAVRYWRDNRHLEAPWETQVILAGGTAVKLGQALIFIRQFKATASWMLPALDVMGMRWETGDAGSAAAALADLLRAEAEEHRAGRAGAGPGPADGWLARYGAGAGSAGRRRGGCC